MSREAFEKWAVGHGLDLSRPYRDGGYGDVGTLRYWLGWSARDEEMAAKDARIAELEEKLRVATAIDWRPEMGLMKESSDE